MTRLKTILMIVIIAACSSAYAQQNDLYSQITPLETAVNNGTASRVDQLQLAQLYIKVGRFYEAGKIADQLLAVNAADAEATAVKGDAARGLRDISQQNIAKAEAAAARTDATDQDRLAVADAYFGAGRYREAADLYAKAPSSLRTRDVRLKEARALAWSSQLDRAEVAYADLLKEQSTPDLQLEYGRTVSWMGASKLSTQTLSDIYQQTHSEESALALADAMSWGGDRAGAVRILTDFTASNPGASAARRKLADLSASPDLRLEQVNRLIETAPYNLALRLEQARLQIEAGRYSEGLKNIKFVEDHSNQKIEGLAELRQRAEEGRRVELARAEDARKALDARNPQNADQILTLAKSYAGLADYNNAIRLYEDYLRIRPDDTDARIQYARVLSWDRRWAPSERQYEKLLADHPDRADLRLEYAEILSYESDFVGAIHAFNSLTDLSSNPRARLYSDVPPQAHFQLGQIYRWFGWNEHAVAEQNEAIAIDGTYGPARQELDLVRHLRPASHLDGTYSYATDSNDFTLKRFDLEAQKWTSRRTAVDLAVGKHYFDYRNDEASANVISVGGQYRWQDRWLARGRVGANFYDKGLGTRPFFGVGAEWLPSIQSRFALDFNHYDLVYDVFSINSLGSVPAPNNVQFGNPLDINDFRGHYDYATGGHWSWLADASYGFISDHNNRVAGHGLLTYRIIRAPFVAVKGDVRYLSYDFRSNRYWSPPSYHSFAGVLQVGDNIKERVFWNIEGKLGKAYEGSANSDIRAYEANVTVPINDAIDAVGNYGYGKSGRIDSLLGSNLDVVNYWQRHFYVGIRLKRLFASEERGTPTNRYYYEPIGSAASPVIPPLGATQ